MTNCDNECWAGFKITKKNPYTFHHCRTKKCDGGGVNVRNGAVLSQSAHRILHKIESVDPCLYEEINNILIEINEDKSAAEERKQKIKKLMKGYI